MHTQYVLVKLPRREAPAVIFRHLFAHRRSEALLRPCGSLVDREAATVLQLRSSAVHRGAGATGLEPATSGVTGRRSNQLSYAPRGIGASPAGVADAQYGTARAR